MQKEILDKKAHEEVHVEIAMATIDTERKESLGNLHHRAYTEGFKRGTDNGIEWALKRMYEQWTTIEDHFKASLTGEELYQAVKAEMYKGYKIN